MSPMPAAARRSETSEANEISKAAAPATEETWKGRLVRNLAPLDWLVLVYFMAFLVALTFGSGPGREHCIGYIVKDIAILATTLVLTRGGILTYGSFANEFIYRIGLFLSVFLSYFQLRDILPAVSSKVLDGEILALDLRLFHYEPSLAWDKFVTPITTEWFAFFYFSHFTLLIIHVFPFMLAARSVERLARFATGLLLVFCVGHVVYMIVPGYGPYRYLASSFHHELTGGTFWKLVQEAVAAGGAQKDIFPSLHTGIPTFFALFAFRHRHHVPFKYVWAVLAVVVSQIIIATMFLRWHYLIDICAGLALAFSADALSVRLVAWDTARRTRLGLPPAWSILQFPRIRRLSSKSNSP